MGYAASLLLGYVYMVSLRLSAPLVVGVTMYSMLALSQMKEAAHNRPCARQICLPHSAESPLLRLGWRGLAARSTLQVRQVTKEVISDARQFLRQMREPYSFETGPEHELFISTSKNLGRGQILCFWPQQDAVLLSAPGSSETLGYKVKANIAGCSYELPSRIYRRAISAIRP